MPVWVRQKLDRRGANHGEERQDKGARRQADQKDAEGGMRESRKTELTDVVAKIRSHASNHQGSQRQPELADFLKRQDCGGMSEGPGHVVCESPGRDRDQCGAKARGRRRILELPSDIVPTPMLPPSMRKMAVTASQGCRT